MKSITIKSPASIANLVCGFDIIGLALEEPYDITVSYTHLTLPTKRIV